MSVTTFSASIAALAFASGSFVSYCLAPASNCLCDCTGGSAQGEVLQILQSQLDRYGPEHLGAPRPPSPEAAAEVWSWGWLVFAVLLGCLFTVAARSFSTLLTWKQVQLSLSPQDAVRWTPPRGSSARRIP